MLEKQMQGLLFLEDSVLIIGDMEIKIYAYPLDSEAHNMLYVTVSTLEPIPSSV
jgi:hypothetical protein